MQLCYRGLSYNNNISEVKARKSAPGFGYGVERGTDSQLTYRGLNYQIDSNYQVPRASTSTQTHQLVYRGIAYMTTRIMSK